MAKDKLLSTLRAAGLEVIVTDDMNKVVRAAASAHHTHENSSPHAKTSGTPAAAQVMLPGMDKFAEIELPSKNEASQYRKERIAPKKQKQDNPHKQVFAEMRALRATDCHYNVYYEETFYRQAKYMENFTDDCDELVPCYADPVRYSTMNYAQLRTYFTWRTKVRQGCVENTSLSYAICYIYELLNNIGVTSAEEGLDKLIWFWTEFRVYDNEIDSYMVKWARDYYVVNRLTEEFASIVKRFPVKYPRKNKTNGILYDKLRLNLKKWDIRFVEKHSSHEMTGMAFYKSSTQMVQQMIEDCLNTVFVALNGLCKANGVELVNLYVPVSPYGYYKPFKNALYRFKDLGSFSVKLFDHEIYHCKNDRWFVCKYNDHPEQYYYTKGYILKIIEIEMRKALGGKPNLKTPKLDSIKFELDSYTWRITEKKWQKKVFSLLQSAEFTQTITNAIQTYCKTENIVVKDGVAAKLKPVEIDASKLDKIREDHEETAKKLIVENPLTDEQPEKALAAPSSPPPEQAAPPAQIETPSGITGFAASLNSEEKAFLVIFLKSAQIPANSELLIEAINEKALASIGDNIMGNIDGTPGIYEEYATELKTALGKTL